MDPGGQHQVFDSTRNKTRGLEKNGGPPQSLIISPNLDALLEYEERIRGLKSLQTSSPIWESPQSSPQFPCALAGLPPPPRKRRKPQSQISPPTEASIGVDTASLGSNPYINSPPSFSFDRHEGPIEEANRAGSAMATVPTEESPRDNPADGRKRRRAHQRSRSAGDEKRPKSQSSFIISQPPSPSSIISPPSPIFRVDKFFNIKKNSFGLFSDPNRKTELSDVSNAPKFTYSQPSPRLSDRSRIKGKLFKLKDPLSGNPDNMPKVIEDTVLDIRQPSPDAFDLSDITFRRHPHSHDSWLPSSSRSSLDSFSSGTTNGPASTIEPRISISSTIYPASSTHSHPHSMYQSTDQHATRPPVSPRRASDADRRSFIEFTSPTRPDFVLKDVPPSAIIHPFQSRSQPATRSSSPKPPIPAAPKPVFDRSSLKTLPRLRQNEPDLPLPPTTNFLDLSERLELIKKNQKLARLFGQSPGPDVSVSPLSRHLRGSLSVSNNLEIDASHYNSLPTWLAAARRHSTPMSPDDFSFPDNSGNGPIKNTVDRSTKSNDLGQCGLPSASSTSFIDLSDDPGSAPLGMPTKAAVTTISLSTQSLIENMSPEEQAEEERRKKRQKLVKLHRFLGSRVPTDLVLGLDPDVPLPPDITVNYQQDSEDIPRKLWARRRRSSSAAVFPSTWSDDVDRLKEDLNDKEKAINVRRAQKMEKVFGVAPPQTLFHTRRSPSPSVGPTTVIMSPKGWTGYATPGDSHSPVYGQRNPNRTSYVKPKPKVNDRPGTSESNKLLLPKGVNSAGYDESPTHGTASRPSIVYSHYQESLNSLNDIIDRDDKESLAELHEYLSQADISISPRLQEFSRRGDRRRSTVSSTKSERRHSLPTSVISVGSEYSIPAPRPEVMDFQARRRRAAKLTQFFGVDYRELIYDVLESIENGLEHERKRGTLNPDEVEDLLTSLRKIQTKRESLL